MRGLVAPRQEPFIQAATGRFLWGRPFQTQLLLSFRQDAENIGVHAWAGCAGLCRMQGGGVVVRALQLLRIWSRQWQAVIHLAIIASTKWDQIARSRIGMLVHVGEENGWKLSVGTQWGTRGYSQCKLTHLRALRSSVQLLFPHRSLEGKSGRAWGTGLISENKARCERREERLTSPQWWHSVPVSAVSAWVAAKMLQWQKWCSICNNAEEICSYRGVFWRESHR